MRPIKLLLVDDLEENLLALELLLRREGLEFHRARSGPEALELLLVHDFALALLDVQMPAMDGFELAELMRGAERTCHVPIIFLTAGARDGQRVFRGYEVGAVDFLYKPLDPVLLGHKVTTFVDLHRQRQESERLADELRDVLRLQEMFVATMSHDLRSPLSTLLTGAALLEDDLTDPVSVQTLGRMQSSARRMSVMLEQLYDLARARLGGGIAIERRDMDLRPLLERLLEEMRLAHPGRALTAEYRGSTAGRWDESRLGQVLANLLGNALRHGVAGGEVRVVVHDTVFATLIDVHNAGEITAAIRPHLFDPFRRGSSVRRDGLGLGLYIVQQIVAAHGGTIEVTSSAAAGTTFRVQLPRAARSSGPTPAP
ncbi:MAG: hybrid sensor histidine kinase/response regulator [Myxococcales bacterium]|nr:MAG: hybrid sensor histidine kinase/response regulator [Myxococcales bacterium]